jgi:exopolysaccharide biosynthesis protein
VLDEAPDVVAGAGLLRRNGAILQDWSSEGLSLDEFTHARHPRTMIGVDRAGYIWLAVIDGRQPSYSIGMTFQDLQRLCDRLNLTDALNLDGGGSTMMVVNGQPMNRVSDTTGPRPVSDAIVVLPR